MSSTEEYPCEYENIYQYSFCLRLLQNLQYFLEHAVLVAADEAHVLHP